ncbi:MAG: hypothetical protein IKH77_09445 [Clostridia bacterium]|nr:hypothetical protein [Clostridia bacterium]
MPWVLVCVGVLAVCVVLRLMLRARQEQQHSRAERVRRTNLYARLYPLIRDLSVQPLEQLAVLEDQVVIRLLRPAREVRFHYEEQGFDPPTPEMRFALAQALAGDFPFLADPARYLFRSRRHQLPNGQRSRWYEYLLTLQEKERLLNRPGSRSRFQDMN